MGSKSSKPKQKVAVTHHICWPECFKKQPQKLTLISDLNWYLTKERANEMKEYLDKYIAEIIIDYLPNYKTLQSDYRAYIHARFPLSNPTNNRICSKWIKKEHITDETHRTQIIVMGASSVGKSSLVLRAITGGFQQNVKPRKEKRYYYKMRLYADEDKKHNKSSFAHLDILDTAGIPPSDFLFTGAFRINSVHWIYVKIFILVFDVMRKHTFYQAREIGERIIAQREETDFGIIFVGNKCDLRKDVENELDLRREPIVDMKEAHRWFETNKVPYIGTSAKNGKNAVFLFRHCLYEYWIQSSIDEYWTQEPSINRYWIND